MMVPTIRRRRFRNEAGFSLVEMLMAAFVLSIGILGITMLQVTSLKVARGSQSLQTATQIAEQIMDRVEMEGRLTLLNITSSNYTVPPAIAGLQYIGQAPGAQQFNVQGQAPVPTSTDPKVRDPFFTVDVVQTPVAVGTQGAAQDTTVTVSWADDVDATATVIQRQVVITRRIVHG